MTAPLTSWRNCCYCSYCYCCYMLLLFFVILKECRQPHDYPSHKELPTNQRAPLPTPRRCWPTCAPAQGGRTQARRLASQRILRLSHEGALPLERTSAEDSQQVQRRVCSLCDRSNEGLNRRQGNQGADLFSHSPGSQTCSRHQQRGRSHH